MYDLQFTGMLVGEEDTALGRRQRIVSYRSPGKELSGYIRGGVTCGFLRVTSLSHFRKAIDEKEREAKASGARNTLCIVFRDHGDNKDRIDINLVEFDDPSEEFLQEPWWKLTKAGELNVW